MVVTINTLEFVAKLKDSDNNSSNSKKQTPDSTLNSSLLNNTLPQAQQLEQQQMPSGYIQNILSKILSNMCVIVNNVIVKFVEDDIVLSFNMKSAEFYSVNEQWEKSFVDMGAATNQEDLHLRKILQLNDVTICLDKLDNKKNTRVNFYQDPLIYRCSIQSRFDFIYSNQSTNNLNQNLFNQQLKMIKLNFYCRKLDVSITDQQLPMLLRLVELILAILDGTLATQSKPEDFEDEPPVLEPIGEQIPIQQDLNQEDQGWMSWAWSYVPSVSTILTEDNQTDLQIDLIPVKCQLLMGFYFDELNVSFKLIQQITQLNESTQHRVKSLSACLFVIINAKGLAIEINKKNDHSHILFGISFINIKSSGDCCCKLCSKPNDNEIIFLKAGLEDLEEKTFHYLSGSLFDIIIDEMIVSNEDEQMSSRDKNNLFDETYGNTRFGAIYLDLVDLTQQNDDLTDDLILKPEVYSFYLLLYKIELNLSANFMHRFLKIYESTQTHSYTQAYSSNVIKPANSIESLTGSYHEQQKTSIERLAHKFEKYSPLMNYNIILKEPSIQLHPYSHYLVANNTNNFDYKSYFLIEANCINFNIRKPIDQEKLFDVITNLINPSKKLIYDCYIHYNLIVIFKI